MKCCYEKVKILWDLAKELKKISTYNSIEERSMLLFKELTKFQVVSPNIINENYKFPSKIVWEISRNNIQLNEREFTLQEIIEKICDNDRLINIDSIILMLKDIVLYKAYDMIDKEFTGGFYNQLNMCIILDEMKIKPDNDVDMVSLLAEVSEKAKLNMDKFSKSIIWAIAMLNYKMHEYDYAIIFFKKFLKMTKEDKDVKEVKRICTRIYIGYCYEKENSQNGFSSAINTFEELLKELEPNQNIKQDLKKDLLVELYHGLGHFYNERAIFGKSNEEESDIINARKYMKKALNESEDYYSCYGSLFHEFGDYETANYIFDEATENEEIKKNNELESEMFFYKAQTCSVLAKEKAQAESAEEKFKKFEKYCEETFNFDGIVHARIFNIRTRLRTVGFGVMERGKRINNREQIENWYKELTQYSLSNYVSKTIKEEYEKTLCILNIFRTLYVDNSFVWHMEDIMYYLQKFMTFMPKEEGMGAYVEGEQLENIKSNLYRIEIDGVNIWCVSIENLEELLEKEGIKSGLRDNGVNLNRIVPIGKVTEAHSYIQQNRKPDLVVLIPPANVDISFEEEVSTIKKTASESYFLFCTQTSEVYSIKWFKNLIRGEQPRYYTDTVGNMLRLAYCCRVLEILRRELLQPIPLFSLAPTHFSSSYDFQLGESIEIQLDAFEKSINQQEQRTLCEQLRLVDNEYSSNLLDRSLVTESYEALNNLECKEDGFFIVCFPRPCAMRDKPDNYYISYLMRDKRYFEEDIFSFQIKENFIYTAKVLSSYRNIFWELEELLGHYVKECPENDKCTGFCEISNMDKEEIIEKCKEILVVIFNKEAVELKYPYKCVLKKSNDDLSKEYIYVLFQKEHDIGKYKEKIENEERNKDEKNTDEKHPTAFVTYAWDPEESEFLKYQKEVLDLVNQLRRAGVDATFDLEEEGNWIQTMIDGLSRDKIIVLLSNEYKRKADKTKDTGVAIERNAIVERLKKEPQSIIFAKLPSQKDKKEEDIIPIIFSGNRVIDLSNQNGTDGIELLIKKLRGKKAVELEEVNTEI